MGSASLRALQQSSQRKLCAILFEDIRDVPLGNEPIRVAGEIVGRMKSGGQGYTLNKGIGYAYLPERHSQPGTTVEVEFFGKWGSGSVAAEPLLDPLGARIKA